MRMGFGLVSLLVGVAIVLWLSAEHTSQVSKTAAPLRAEVQQMSGRDETGAAATDALKLESAERGGKSIGSRVASVTAGSAIETYYGIRADDVIVQAGDMPLGDPFVGDVQTASAMILKAYQEQRPLTVQRGAEKLTLPQPKGAAPTPTPAAAPPAPTANPAPQQPGGLQKQLELIRGAGGGQ